VCDGTESEGGEGALAVILDRHYGWARAYRNGQCVCRRADVVVGQDTRQVGLAPHERRRVTVRFLEQLDPGLREELLRLQKRRGMDAKRLAADVPPIELVIHDPHVGSTKLIGRIQAPQMRHVGDLRDMEFTVREVENL
jgi:hypothetical protein